MKEIIQCSICNHPHCADIFTLQMTFAKNSGASIDSVRQKTICYICESCIQKEDYHSNNSYKNSNLIFLDAQTKVTRHSLRHHE